MNDLETDFAVMKNDILYIKQSIEALTKKIEAIDSSTINVERDKRIGLLEQRQAVLESKVKINSWVFTTIGAACISAIVAAIIKLI